MMRNSSKKYNNIKWFNNYINSIYNGWGEGSASEQQQWMWAEEDRSVGESGRRRGWGMWWGSFRPVRTQTQIWAQSQIADLEESREDAQKERECLPVYGESILRPYAQFPRLSTRQKAHRVLEETREGEKPLSADWVVWCQFWGWTQEHRERVQPTHSEESIGEDLRQCLREQAYFQQTYVHYVLQEDDDAIEQTRVH